MSPGDIIVIALIGLILGVAIGGIIKSKRSGKKCVGCPGGELCGGNCGSCGLK